MQNFKFLYALLAAGLLSSNLVNAANTDQLPDITHHDDWSSSGYVVPGIPYLSLPRSHSGQPGHVFVAVKYFNDLYFLGQDKKWAKYDGKTPPSYYSGALRSMIIDFMSSGPPLRMVSGEEWTIYFGYSREGDLKGQKGIDWAFISMLETHSYMPFITGKAGIAFPASR